MNNKLCQSMDIIIQLQRKPDFSERWWFYSGARSSLNRWAEGATEVFPYQLKLESRHVVCGVSVRLKPNRAKTNVEQGNNKDYWILTLKHAEFLKFLQFTHLTCLEL